MAKECLGGWVLTDRSWGKPWEAEKKLCLIGRHVIELRVQMGGAKIDKRGGIWNEIKKPFKRDIGEFTAAVPVAPAGTH